MTASDTITNQDSKKLAIVIPLANESDTLRQFYEEIIQHVAPFEDRLHIKIFFVVDHASKDNTRQIVEGLQKQDRRVQLVWAPQNRCVVDAYCIGFQRAFEDNFDYILEMDGGFSHLPGDIHFFIERLLEGYDCVLGSRFLTNGGIETNLMRLFLSRGGNLAANILLGMKSTDATSGFEGFQADVLKRILSRKLVSRGHFFQTEVRFRARNFNCIEVPIHYSNPSKRVSLQSVRNAFWGLFVCVTERMKGS